MWTEYICQYMLYFHKLKDIQVYPWHNLLFLFCLSLFYLFLPSMGWLVGVFELIECSHSLPALHSGLHNNNNNNNNNKQDFTSLLATSGI